MGKQYYDARNEGYAVAKREAQGTINDLEDEMAELVDSHEAEIDELEEQKAVLVEALQKIERGSYNLTVRHLRDIAKDALAKVATK
jgi:uncharacterized protein YhaN